MPADGGVISGPLTFKTFTLIASTGSALGTLVGFTIIGCQNYLEKNRKEKASQPDPKMQSAAVQKTNWSRRGNIFTLEWTMAGILMVFLVPETHIINGELKMGAQFLMNEVAEHYPSAKVSFHDCLFVIEQGKNTIR